MTNAMEYIYTIYETGSFSIAAEKLCITQPALSIAVKKEEAAWNTTFFDRNSHPIQLTVAGKIYIEKVKEIMKLEVELKHQLNDLTSLSTGDLSIGGTQFINSYILPPIINSFLKTYPGIKIKLLEASPESSLQLLANGDIDISFNAGLYEPKEFSQTPIFQDHILLALPKCFDINKRLKKFSISRKQICAGDIFLHQAPRISAEYFSDIPMILLNSKSNLYQIAMSICQDSGFVPNTVFQVEQSTTAYNLARVGVGAVWISNLIVKYFPDCDMVYYLVRSEKIHRTYHSLTSKKHYTNRAASEFIKVCQTKFQNYPV